MTVTNSTGTAVEVNGDDTKLDDVSVSGNNGTAVVVNGDNTSIENSEFSNNTGDEAGGAILINGDNTSIDNTTFVNNTAPSGGAIFVNGNNTNITGSTFKGNYAPDGSNAIAVNGSDHVVSIDDATVANSDADQLPLETVIVDSIDADASDAYESDSPVVITVNVDADEGTVSTTIDGKTYTGSVSDGVGVISIPDLAAGNYTDVVVKYSTNTGEHTNSSTTVNFTVKENLADIIHYDVTKDYNSNYKYKILVIGVDGKPVGEGVGFSITISGKTKTYYTDANGYITIKLGKTYTPGKYTVKMSWKGINTKHVITVKQILKSQKVTKIKKSAVKVVLKASLKTSAGKPIKGKKITFKFKGKTYSAKTNKKGIAKITIKKSVIKKLKAGKTYTVKVTYLKDTFKTYIKVRK